MFNLQQLETLILCVECGSFSAAARKQKKAQSAVSTAIANLEIDTGIEIFDRSTRIPTLTAHGERLYIQALNLMSQANEIKAMLNAFSAEVEDSLTIVIHELLLAPPFFKVIEAFYQRFPHTELSIEVVKNQEISHLVSEQKASIGFMLCEDTLPPEVELGLVGYLPFSIAVNHSHPLLRQTSVQFNDLKTFRQVLLTDMQNPWSTSFASSMIKTNNVDALSSLLVMGDVWSVIPDHTIDKCHSLTALQIDAEEKKWMMHVDRVTRRNQKFGLALAWLYEQSTNMFETDALKL